MTISNPEPDNTTAVEPKVKWGAIATYLAGVVFLGLVNLLTDNENELLIASLPDMIEPFVLPIVPTVVGLVSAYFARHQWRSAEISGPRNPV